MTDWLTIAEWDWVRLGGGERLHAVAWLANADTADDEWYGVGYTECALEGEMTIPGPFSRMSVPRCKRCCKRRGMPEGDGSPKNDDACRALVESRLADELERLRAENSQLREAFEELLEEAGDMRTYVPDYFAKKWKHDEALANAQAVLASLASEPTRDEERAG